MDRSDAAPSVRRVDMLKRYGPPNTHPHGLKKLTRRTARCARSQCMVHSTTAAATVNGSPGDLRETVCILGSGNW